MATPDEPGGALAVLIDADNANPAIVKGLIDEVAMWHSVLTPGEVAKVYNGGSPVDLNALGGTIVGIYSALPPTKPAVTAVVCRSARPPIPATAPAR
jgi:hypothetical protein